MALRELFSASLYYLSWIAAFLSALATAGWIAIVADGNYCWSAFVFMMSAGPLSAVFLFLLVIPSVIVYFKRRQKRDFRTICLAGCSFFILLVEIALVTWVIPQRGE